jgi:hypothetical protein
MGHKRKYSIRAQNVRFAPESGLRNGPSHLERKFVTL